MPIADSQCQAQVHASTRKSTNHPDCWLNDDAQTLTVGLGDGGAADREYPAEVLFTDADNDLAVLRIAQPPANLPTIACAPASHAPFLPPSSLIHSFP